MVLLSLHSSHKKVIHVVWFLNPFVEGELGFFEFIKTVPHPVLILFPPLTLLDKSLDVTKHLLSV